MALCILLSLSLLAIVAGDTSLDDAVSDAGRELALETCPDGSQPLEGYFAYQIKLNGFQNDCSKKDISVLEATIDDIITFCEQTYPLVTFGGELTVKTCNRGEFVQDRRNLRVKEEPNDPFHRQLGVYTRSGGGYCRRCSSYRRELGKKDKGGGGDVVVEEDLKTVEEELTQVVAEEEQILQEEVQVSNNGELNLWIKGFQSYIAEVIETTLMIDLHRHRCATSDARVQVDIQVLSSAADLPC